MKKSGTLPNTKPKQKERRGETNFFDYQIDELKKIYPEYLAQPQNHRNPIMRKWKEQTAKEFMVKHGANKKRPDKTDEEYYNVRQ